MAIKKGLSLINEIKNFANAYLGKFIKIQGNGLLRFGARSHLQGWRWKTPPGMNRVMSFILNQMETWSKLSLDQVSFQAYRASILFYLILYWASSVWKSSFTHGRFTPFFLTLN